MENKAKLMGSLFIALLIFTLAFVAIAPPALASKGQVMITDVNGIPKDCWKVGETLFITVIDPDEDRDSDEVELLKGTVEDQLGNLNPVIQLIDPNTGDREESNGGGIQLVLQETGINTGKFRSAFGIRIVKKVAGTTATPNNGILEVEDNDTIAVYYQDPSDPTDIDADLAKIEMVRATIAITDEAGNPVPLFNVGDDVFVTVTDPDENIDPVTVETIEGVILERPRLDPDTGEVEQEVLVLVETGPDTGIFRNADGVTLQDRFGTTATSDHVLAVRDKDTILAYYRSPAGVAPTPPIPPGTRTDSAENAFFKFERTVPVKVGPGDTFTVTVKLTNLTSGSLDLVAFTDTLPTGLTLVSGKLTDFRSGVAAGASATFTYKVRAGATPGTFTITGTARATGAPSLSLSSGIEVGASAAAAVAANSYAPEAIDIVQNGNVSLQREFPGTVAPGEVFTVTTTITAKVALELVAINVHPLPGDFQFVSGKKTAFETDLQPGDTLVNSFEVRAGDVEGTFTISAMVRSKAVGAASLPLTLDSHITVGAVPPVPVGFGLGDPNDPSDFVLAKADIAEPNPGRVAFTDEAGREKASFRIGEDIFVTVRDDDENMDSDAVEIVYVNIYNINGGQELQLELLETGLNTGVFRNSPGVKIVGVDSDLGKQDLAADLPGYIAVHNEDTIYVIYQDTIWITLDPFDIDAATATITDCQVFNCQGENELMFVSDVGNPVDSYKKGHQAFVKLTDCDQNQVHDLVETVTVILFDRDTGDEEEVILEETGPDTSVFQSPRGVTLLRWEEGAEKKKEPDDGILRIEERDLILASYQDPNNPSDFSVAKVEIVPRPTVPINTASRTRFTDSRGRDMGSYVVGDNVYVTVDDQDENRTPGVPDTIEGAVVLENPRTGDSMTVDLEETGPDTGIFISEAITTSAPVEGGQLEVEPGDVLEATYTDPNYPEDISSDTVSIESPVLVVEAYVNQPNPLINVTTFRVIGAGVQRIRVWVYDLSGMLVFEKEADGDRLTWNGINTDGDLLANGVYLYMIEAVGKDRSETSPVRKLVILR